MADSSAPKKDPAGSVVGADGDFAGALHEVSNALTVVIGWLERARAGDASRAEIDRALEVASARASLARDIVRRAIGAEVNAEALGTVRSIVDDALLGLEPELSRSDLRIALDVDGAIEASRVPDASKVLQILTNLLLNATAFSPTGGAIVVEAKGARDRVRFAVQDEGEGIPEARKATLFDGGVSTRPGGAGVGLRHAAQIARESGGELALADSVKGARFELTWPLGELAPVSVAVPRRKSLALSGARILLVEDDEAVIDLVETALTARGAAVVSVKRRADLARALADGRFDAALFDISPIQSDVLGALAEVKAASANVKLVVISGSAMAVPALPAEWMTSWVRKPFEIAEIVHAIEGDARSISPPPARTRSGT